MTSTTVAPAAAGALAEVRYAGFWAGAWRRFRRNGLAMFGLVFVVFILLIAVFASVLVLQP